MKQPQIPRKDPERPASPPAPAGIPFEIPVPPPAPDSLPDIRSWQSLGRGRFPGGPYRTLEGGVRHHSQNPWDRAGADAVWFPGQNSDPAHF